MKPNSPRCAACRRRGAPTLCSLFEDAQHGVASRAAVHTFRRGQLLLHAGLPVTALYVVHTGSVKVFRTRRNGDEQVLRLLGPGELLGYRPLLAGEPAVASAEAVEDCTVCVIPAADLRAMIAGLPDLARALLGKLARELRTSEDLMMDLLHHPVRQRVARLLLSLDEHTRGGSHPGVIDGRHLRRQDMARMIGTTPESLSRVLRALADRGVVALSRNSLRILQAAALRAMLRDDDSSAT